MKVARGTAVVFAIANPLWTGRLAPRRTDFTTETQRRQRGRGEPCTAETQRTQRGECVGHGETVANAPRLPPASRRSQGGRSRPVQTARPEAGFSRPPCSTILYPCSSVFICGEAAFICGSKARGLTGTDARALGMVGARRVAGGASRPAAPSPPVGGASRPAADGFHHRGTEDTERARRAMHRRDAENAERRMRRPRGDRGRRTRLPHCEPPLARREKLRLIILYPCSSVAVYSPASVCVHPRGQNPHRLESLRP